MAPLPRSLDGQLEGTMTGAVGADKQREDTARPDALSPAWSRSYRPDGGVVAFDVGERSLWFSERAQQLSELNATAALIWRALSRGQTPQRVVRSLVDAGVAIEEARS